MVLREKRVEPLAIDLLLDLLGADEDGEPDAGEDASLLLVDADVDEGLHERVLPALVHAALELVLRQEEVVPALGLVLAATLYTDYYYVVYEVAFA